MTRQKGLFRRPFRVNATKYLLRLLCLDIDASTLSKYESGTRDMQISLLPLTSIYYNFPMYELFPREESASILDVFALAVKVTVDGHKRQDEYRNKRRKKAESEDDARELKGYVYEVDGAEIYEPAIPRLIGASTLKEQYRRASIPTDTTPCSGQNFCDFIKEDIPDSIQPVMDAGQFLNSVADVPKKNGLRDSVADYIVDEIVMNRITADHDDERSKRMYAYYCELYKKCYDAK